MDKEFLKSENFRWFIRLILLYQNCELFKFKNIYEFKEIVRGKNYNNELRCYLCLTSDYCNNCIYRKLFNIKCISDRSFSNLYNYAKTKKQIIEAAYARAEYMISLLNQNGLNLTDFTN
jgi:hypothetical protein